MGNKLSSLHHHGETSFNRSFSAIMQVDDKLLLDACEAAVRSNVHVRSFDDAIRDRTSRLLRSFFPVRQSDQIGFSDLESSNIAGSTSVLDAENQSLISFESLKEVTEFMLDTDREVSELILSYREDTWNNDALFLLVEEYLDISHSHVEFCEEAENSIKRAKDDAQTFLGTALKSVPGDRDPSEDDMKRADAYLSKYLEAKEPFGKEFRDKLDAVQRRHMKMVENLKAQEKELQKKLRKNQVWESISFVLFIASVAAILISSIVAAAIAAPPVAAAILAALNIPFGSMGAWRKSFWKKHRQGIEEKLELVRNMHIRSEASARELESIKALVKGFQIQLGRARSVIEFVGTGNDPIAMRLKLDDIKRKKEEFVSTLHDLHEHILRIKGQSKEARERVVGMLKNRRNS